MIPTKNLEFTIPAGAVSPAGIACAWEPSPGNSQPGSVSCDPGEMVLCTGPANEYITCKGDNHSVGNGAPTNCPTISGTVGF